MKEEGMKVRVRKTNGGMVRGGTKRENKRQQVNRVGGRSQDTGEKKRIRRMVG